MITPKKRRVDRQFFITFAVSLLLAAGTGALTGSIASSKSGAVWAAAVISGVLGLLLGMVDSRRRQAAPGSNNKAGGAEGKD